MSCGFDKGLLAAHYDGETSHGEAVEVERHIGSCPECARDLASMKELSAALKPLGRATAPMSIAEEVLRQIGPTARARGPWLRWGLSAAAAVLIAGVTFVVMDNRRAPEPQNVALAEKPAAKKAEVPAAARKDSREEGKEAAPHAAQAPAAEEAPRPVERGKREAAVRVIRVSAGDVAGARGEVEAFLKERELKTVEGAPLLGRNAVARDRYLQLDLTDEELKELEKRLAARKETTLAPGSLEAEKKRVAEELAKTKTDGTTLGADSKSRESLDDATADRARGLAGPKDRDQGPSRRNVIFVFEPAEAKK